MDVLMDVCFPASFVVWQYVIDSGTTNSGITTHVIKLRKVHRVSRLELKLNANAWSSGGCASLSLKACLAERKYLYCH